MGQWGRVRAEECDWGLAGLALLQACLTRVSGTTQSTFPHGTLLSPAGRAVPGRGLDILIAKLSTSTGNTRGGWKPAPRTHLGSLTNSQNTETRGSGSRNQPKCKGH